MRINVGNFLRAATMAAHGTIAGQIQGEQERAAEQQQQFQRDRSLFEMGNSLESERNRQEENYDQGVRSMLPSLGDTDRAAYEESLGKRAAGRAQRASDVYNQFAGKLGFPAFSPTPGAPGGSPPSSPTGAPSSPPGASGAAAALGVSPLPPAESFLHPQPQPAQDQPPAAAPAGAGGAGGAGGAALVPATPAPQSAPQPSAAQMMMMHQVLLHIAPLVPGGQQMVDTLHAYHPPGMLPAGYAGPPSTLQPPAAPVQNALAPAPAPGAAASPAPAAKVSGASAAVTPPAAPAGTPQSTTPNPPVASPDPSGAISLPGFPTVHLNSVSKEDKAAAWTAYKAAVADSKNLDPALATAAAPWLTETGKIETKEDVQRVWEATSHLRQLGIGSGRTQEELVGKSEKALEARAQALPRDNSVAVGEIGKLADDYAHHQQVYPNNGLRDYFGDPQMQRDIAAMKQARASGDEDTAEQIAATIRGRLSKGMSPTQEKTNLAYVYKDIANATTADANNPAKVREFYARHGLGYMVDDVPDEALRSGGWRAQKALEGTLKAISSPGFARLKPEDQVAQLDAARELVHESGFDGKITIPASMVLRSDPMVAKRLELLGKQIDLTGSRIEVGKAHLKIDQQHLDLDRQRLDLAQKKFAAIGKKNGANDKTWNREALEHRDMWMQAEKEKASWLRGDKTTIADKKSWSADETATYNTLNDKAANRKAEYEEFFRQHGVPTSPSTSTSAKPTTNPSKPISEMSAAEAGAELAKEMAKLPARRK